MEPPREVPRHGVFNPESGAYKDVPWWGATLPSMVQRIITELVDDIDSTTADETLYFALDRVVYEIDLSEGNAAKFRETMSSWVGHARRVRGVGRQVSRVTPRARVVPQAPTAVDPRAVRRWAAAKGIPVNDKGRVPAAIVDQFVAAGN